MLFPDFFSLMTQGIIGQILSSLEGSVLLMIMTHLYYNMCGGVCVCGHVCFWIRLVTDKIQLLLIHVN